MAYAEDDLKTLKARLEVAKEEIASLKLDLASIMWNLTECRGRLNFCKQDKKELAEKIKKHENAEIQKALREVIRVYGQPRVSK